MIRLVSEYINEWKIGMAKIGILTCSNSTHDLSCSLVNCLANLRKMSKDEKM